MNRKSLELLIKSISGLTDFGTATRAFASGANCPSCKSASIARNGSQHGLHASSARIAARARETVMMTDSHKTYRKMKAVLGLAVVRFVTTKLKPNGCHVQNVSNYHGRRDSQPLVETSLEAFGGLNHLMGMPSKYDQFTLFGFGQTRFLGGQAK